MATASTSISGNDLSPNANPPRVESSFVALDVPRFKEVHCSTVQVAKGLQYVTWFGGTKEGHADVKIWFSRRREGSKTWEAARSIAGHEGVVHWNPVSFLPNASDQPGWLIVFFKIGTPIPTWRTYWIETRDGGDTWSTPQELVEGDTSGGRGPQKNPPIVLSNGDWLSGSSKEVTLPGGKGKWDAFSDAAPRPSTTDNWAQGERWIRSDFVPLPDDRGVEGGSFPGEGVIQPSMWEDPSRPGRVSMMLRSSNGWIQRTDSDDWGRTWSIAYNSPLPSNNSGQCVALMRDGRLVCAYNPVPINWGPRTPLILSISSDDGHTWKHWCTLEDKPVPKDFERVVALETGIVNDGQSEFSYPTVTPTAEGDTLGVWVSYTWQRRGVVVAKVYDA